MPIFFEILVKTTKKVLSILITETSEEKPHKFFYTCVSYDHVQPPLTVSVVQQATIAGLGAWNDTRTTRIV